MDNDSFHQSIIFQYKDELVDLYRECLSESSFDYELFNQKIEQIWSCASFDGLEEHEFLELVSTLAEDHMNEIQFPFPRAA